MIGLVFGAIYVALPAISGALLTEPIQLIPIPFVDFTQVTGNFIPATPLDLLRILGPVFAGLVVPILGSNRDFLLVYVSQLWQIHYYTPILRPGVRSRICCSGDREWEQSILFL